MEHQLGLSQIVYTRLWNQIFVMFLIICYNISKTKDLILTCNTPLENKCLTLSNV